MGDSGLSNLFSLFSPSSLLAFLSLFFLLLLFLLQFPPSTISPVTSDGFVDVWPGFLHITIGRFKFARKDQLQDIKRAMQTLTRFPDKFTYKVTGDVFSHEKFYVIEAKLDQASKDSLESWDCDVADAFKPYPGIRFENKLSSPHITLAKYSSTSTPKAIPTIPTEILNHQFSATHIDLAMAGKPYCDEGPDEDLTRRREWFVDLDTKATHTL